jgi:hypothetical protein
MMVPNALGNIMSRLESQKIVGIDNLRVSVFLKDWLEPVSTGPNFQVQAGLGLRAPNFAHR